METSEERNKERKCKAPNLPLRTTAGGFGGHHKPPKWGSVKAMINFPFSTHITPGYWRFQQKIFIHMKRTFKKAVIAGFTAVIQQFVHVEYLLVFC